MAEHQPTRGPIAPDACDETSEHDDVSNESDREER